LSYKNPTALRVSNRLLATVNNFVHSKAHRTFKAGYAESLELLRYEANQLYHGHFDNFGGADGPTMRARRKKKMKKKNGNSMVDKTSSVLALDRAVTFIVFLNNMSDVSDGGHTTFPLSAGGFDPADESHSNDNAPGNLKRWQAQLSRFDLGKGNSCNNTLLPSPFPSSFRGGDGGTLGSSEGPPPRPFLKIRPVVGSAVLFYDLYENGVADPFSLHAGCPPLSAAALQRLNATGDVKADTARKYVVTKWFMTPLPL
jgi:hypothetical protein